MTSYEELTPDQRKQVDAFMTLLADNGVFSPMDDLEY
jgi:hypothetical protein